MKRRPWLARMGMLLACLFLLATCDPVIEQWEAIEIARALVREAEPTRGPLVFEVEQTHDGWEITVREDPESPGAEPEWERLVELSRSGAVGLFM